MSNGSDAPSIHEQLSALVDGELAPGAVASACLAWRDDAASQASWHAYHLIGDVLRSDDLASRPSRDAAFLASLRTRLAAEPVVLAPSLPMASDEAARAVVDLVPAARVGAARNSRWNWMAPSAVAASFVVVAGALMATHPNTPAPETALASSSPSPTFESVATSGPVAMLPSPAASAFAVSDTLAPPTYVIAPDRQFVRDARLDRYLAAHKEFAGSTALGVPSGFLRDAVAESPSR